ncbi:MAG: Clp protease N-terminal domain-containing protein [bacterium]
MIERFTEKAIKVILLAQEEAFIAKHEKLYPEHILLGLLREGSGLSAKLLRASGLTLEILREEITKIPFKQTELSNTSESLPFSPAVKKILREAWYESQSVGAYYVTPENLFVCLLREENTSIINLLRNLDIDIARIKTSVKRSANKSIKPNNHPEDVSKSVVSIANLDTSLLFEDENLNKIMNIAKEKLIETNREAYGTEQLFIGMLENKENWLAQILESEGVNIDNFMQKLNEINSRKDEYNEDEPQLTPKAYKAVSSAYDLAREFGSTYIKPEHVLLGILKEKNGLASRILEELNIDIDSLFHKIINPIEKEKPEILTIIKLAQEEARRMEQNIVGTEQILLGILGEGAGVAAKVLRDLGITLKDLRIEVQKVIGFGHHYSEEKEMLFTPRAKRVLALAWAKAKRFHHAKIKSEHLLLAITREKDSMAMKVLGNVGVDVLEIRQGILNEIKKGDITGFDKVDI